MKSLHLAAATLLLFLTATVTFAASFKPVLIGDEVYYIEENGQDQNGNMHRVGKMHVPCPDGRPSCAIIADYYVGCEEGAAFITSAKVMTSDGYSTYSPFSKVGKMALSEMIAPGEVKKIYRYFCQK